MSRNQKANAAQQLICSETGKNRVAAKRQLNKLTSTWNIENADSKKKYAKIVKCIC